MQLTCAITRQIYHQPPVEPLRIQGPLYEKLEFRTRTRGQVQSPAARSSGGHLALSLPPPPPQPAATHHSVPGKPSCVTSAGFQFVLSWQKLSAWKQRSTQNTGYEESVSKSLSPLYRHSRGSCQKASASGRKTGLEDRGLPLSTLLLQALENLVLSTVSIEPKFCQLLGY